MWEQRRRQRTDWACGSRAYVSYRKEECRHDDDAAAALMQEAEPLLRGTPRHLDTATTTRNTDLVEWAKHLPLDSPAAAPPHIGHIHCQPGLARKCTVRAYSIDDTSSPPPPPPLSSFSSSSSDATNTYRWFSPGQRDPRSCATTASWSSWAQTARPAPCAQSSTKIFRVNSIEKRTCLPLNIRSDLGGMACVCGWVCVCQAENSRSRRMNDAVQTPT